MMEVQPLMSCLPPTQRLSSHQPSALLRSLSNSPLAVSLVPPSPRSHPSTMIIEASLHSSATTPPESPQQGETIPGTEIPEDLQKEFNISETAQKDRNIMQELPSDTDERHNMWNGNGGLSDAGDGEDGFSQDVMNTEDMDREGAALSPLPPQSSPKEDNHQTSNDCYTPPFNTNSSQDGNDRRTNRRKMKLEDIVRRMRNVEEPADFYDSEEGELEEDEDDMDEHSMMVLDGTHMGADEVDGAPLHLSNYPDPQAFAESAIKRSMQVGYDDSEEMEQEELRERNESLREPTHFLHLHHNTDIHRNYMSNLKFPSEPKLADSVPDEGRPSPVENQEMYSAGQKILINPFHKPSLHLSPSMGGGPPASLPMTSNISESAFSPHHYSTPKMNGWFPGGLSHMFPFSPAGLMDPPGFGRKFLPFDSKLMPEVDKDYLKCSFCERTFRRQKNLENHIENTHQGKGPQRPKRENGDMYFKCTHCPYTTKHQSNLYVHLRIHTGERPYICGACGVQYSQSHSLKSHIINKHDGIMSYYIKEKRNRSPRGLGYMTTQVISPGEPGIFKLTPPQGLPPLSQSSMEMVAKAIEMAKNSNGEMNHHPPALVPTHPSHHISHAGPQHSFGSPLMSPNTSLTNGHHMFSKHSPHFPFSGHFFGGALPYGDLAATPTPAMIPLPSPGGHLPSGPNIITSCSNNNTRNEVGLNLTTSLTTPTSASSYLPQTNAVSHAGGSLLSSPNSNSNNNNSSNNNNNNSNNSSKKAPDNQDCGAIDLSKKAQDQNQHRGVPDSSQEHVACQNCAHAGKLKKLRFNVVRMLSILVPNLNFEEKGISADSDSVDELLQDVIESNTHDDDLVL